MCATLMCGGCGSISRDEGRRAPVALLPAPAPQTVQRFAPGIISDAAWQWRIAFTPDGGTVFFAVSDGFFPATRKATIMSSRRQSDGTWSQPVVAPFSGTHSDIDPFVSADGNRVYFSSIRPEGGAERRDLDLFVTTRTGAGWDVPVRLGVAVNSELDELYPSQSDAGVLFFASGPLAPGGAGDWDIFSADSRGGGFAARTPLDGINTDHAFNRSSPLSDWEFNPEVDRGGKWLLFTAHRPAGAGAGDLYFSCLRDGRWTAPRNLGPPVNTADDEFHPTISRDRRTLYFARTVLGGSPSSSDFHHVATSAVPVLAQGMRECQ